MRHASRFLPKQLDEGVFGYLNVPHRPELLLSLSLPMEQFHFPGDVSAVALGGHVLAESPQILTG